jgi:uncharacterized protein
MLKDKIRNITASTEFFLIVTICLSYFILRSIWAIFYLNGNVVYTDTRVLIILFVEILALIISYNILTLRGWSKEDFQFKISWSLSGIGILLLCICYFLYMLTGSLIIAFLEDSNIFSHITFQNEVSFPTIIGICTINSIFEESVVSRYVIRSLENKGPFYAISVSVLLRFLYHVYQGPVAVISVIPLGLVFGFVYWRTRQLWPLILAHSLMNLIAFSR